MKLKSIITLSLAWLLSVTATAQKLTVESMALAGNDISASQFERKDLNKQPCALVKVQLAAFGAVFEGNVIGDVAYKTGEYWVYMSEGSQELRVKHANYLPLHITFANYGVHSVKGKTTYNLTISKPMLQPGNDDDGTSYLIMTITPKNSTVFVDDQLQTVTDGTMRVRLTYGQHSYRVDANGYATEQGIVEIGPGRKDMTISLQSRMGTINVNCPTSGMQVYINDQLRGTAPWKGTLPAGTYLVEGRKQGYYSQKQSVILAERDNLTVNLPALLAQVGRLDVDYQPVNAEVYLDGTLLGKSPDVFRNIGVGSHSLEVRAAGYQSKTETINIVENQTYMMKGSLKRNATDDDEIAGKSADDICSLGYAYNNGTNGKTKNHEKGLKYYRIAADKGSAQAMANLGIMFKKGEGVAIDYTEALKWLRKAADQNNSTGLCALGEMYQGGYGVTKDNYEALKWFRKAADQKDRTAYAWMGYMYEFGHGVTKDLSQAKAWYQKGADVGDDYSKNKLKESQFSSVTASTSSSSYSSSSYDSEIEGKTASAINNLAIDYEKGQNGKTKDMAKAVRYYKIAAEKGDSYAQSNLGLVYHHAKGVTQDYAEAVKWYRKSADQGNKNGQYNLGIMYKNGYGVTKDYAEALRLFRKSAEQGDASAQNQMGVMYYEGYGVTKDNYEAVKWFRKAAEQNDANACSWMGFMYENGYGVTKDITQAKYWYKKGADLGDDFSVKKMREL